MDKEPLYSVQLTTDLFKRLKKRLEEDEEIRNKQETLSV